MLTLSGFDGDNYGLFDMPKTCQTQPPQHKVTHPTRLPRTEEAHDIVSQPARLSRACVSAIMRPAGEASHAMHVRCGLPRSGSRVTLSTETCIFYGYVGSRLSRMGTRDAANGQSQIGPLRWGKSGFVEAIFGTACCRFAPHIVRGLELSIFSMIY